MECYECGSDDIEEPADRDIFHECQNCGKKWALDEDRFVPWRCKECDDKKLSDKLRRHNPDSCECGEAFVDAEQHYVRYNEHVEVTTFKDVTGMSPKQLRKFRESTLIQETMEGFREARKELDEDVSQEELASHEFERSEDNPIKCVECGGGFSAHLRAAVLEEKGDPEL